jgi:hypothetical protein
MEVSYYRSAQVIELVGLHAEEESLPLGGGQPDDYAGFTRAPEQDFPVFVRNLSALS